MMSEQAEWYSLILIFFLRWPDLPKLKTRNKYGHQEKTLFQHLVVWWSAWFDEDGQVCRKKGLWYMGGIWRTLLVISVLWLGLLTHIYIYHKISIVHSGTHKSVAHEKLKSPSWETPENRIEIQCTRSFIAQGTKGFQK